MKQHLLGDMHAKIHKSWSNFLKQSMKYQKYSDYGYMRDRADSIQYIIRSNFMKRRNFLKNTIGIGAIAAASTLSTPAISKGKN